MAKVRRVTARGRLAQEAFSGGGMPVAEAVLRAETAAGPALAACKAELQRALTALTVDFRRVPPGPASLEPLYRLSERVIELSDESAPAGVIEVARSLCDIADSYAARDACDWRAIDVHLSALTLLTADPPPPAEVRATILGGLAQVRGRLA
jgi:hypothetical protein